MNPLITATEYDIWGWVPDPIREPLGYAMMAVGFGLLVWHFYEEKFTDGGEL